MRPKTADIPQEDDEASGRALWKGSISFGLIDIPVSLHSAEKRKGLRFSMLDGRDLSPIRYERVSARTGRPVPWEDVVKGFEYDDGSYVVVGEAELKQANPEATQSVDILAFVDVAEIPPEYFDRPYYLRPLKRGRKGYALLRDTLVKSGRVGIAKVVIRTRQHLAALIPRDGILALELLRWPDELRVPSEMGMEGMTPRALGVSAKEVEMAGKLVEGMVETWRPDQYEDTYRRDVMKLIEKKVKAGKLTAVEDIPEEEPRARRGTEVVDFMSLLRKSIEEKAKAGAKSAARKRAAKPAPRRKAARSA